ncbi:basic proline-rich protein-like isoform X3 [Canis lupus familiaris]|uniref:basic proline-rich protein-like isoform X3 n=1 Tax=Canis lupus familiaris TaxID=9615 RepID=UPI0018F6C377|nr:basic proline-rich protein-like isoform X3 [Canis lupus familiaris]
MSGLASRGPGAGAAEQAPRGRPPGGPRQPPPPSTTGAAAQGGAAGEGRGRKEEGGFGQSPAGRPPAAFPGAPPPPPLGVRSCSASRPPPPAAQRSPGTRGGDRPRGAAGDAGRGRGAKGPTRGRHKCPLGCRGGGRPAAHRAAPAGPRARCQHREGAGAGACAEPGCAGPAASMPQARRRGHERGAPARPPRSILGRPRALSPAAPPCSRRPAPVGSCSAPAPPRPPPKMASRRPSPGSGLPPHNAPRGRSSRIRAQRDFAGLARNCTARLGREMPSPRPHAPPPPRQPCHDLQPPPEGQYFQSPRPPSPGAAPAPAPPSARKAEPGLRRAPRRAQVTPPLVCGLGPDRDVTGLGLLFLCGARAATEAAGPPPPDSTQRLGRRAGPAAGVPGDPSKPESPPPARTPAPASLRGPIPGLSPGGRRISVMCFRAP